MILKSLNQNYQGKDYNIGRASSNGIDKLPKGLLQDISILQQGQIEKQIQLALKSNQY